MKKFRENVKKLYYKIVDFVEKYLSKWIYFFLVCALIWQCFNCCGVDTSDNTAYALPANRYQTEAFGTLNGGFTIQSSGTSQNRFYTFDNTRVSTHNLSYYVRDNGYFFYMELPVQYIYNNLTSLQIEFDQVQLYDELVSMDCDYSLTYTTEVGNLTDYTTREFGFRYDYINISNGYSIDIIQEILADADLIGVDNRLIRINYLRVGFHFDEIYNNLDFNGSVTARNTSNFYYSDYVDNILVFEKYYEEYLTTTVADTFDTIVTTQNSLLSLEIFPNFTIGSLLLLMLTIPVVIFIAKLFLGG